MHAFPPIPDSGADQQPASAERPASVTLTPSLDVSGGGGRLDDRSFLDFIFSYTGRAPRVDAD
ncbi:MAG: hypothetical protein M3065_15080 [Actinomycetota bacterium]|nr:hypothetical protein [Actinomycetota bacterium]